MLQFVHRHRAAQVRQNALLHVGLVVDAVQQQHIGAFARQQLDVELRQRIVAGRSRVVGILLQRHREFYIHFGVLLLVDGDGRAGGGRIFQRPDVQRRGGVGGQAFVVVVTVYRLHFIAHIKLGHQKIPVGSAADAARVVALHTQGRGVGGHDLFRQGAAGRQTVDALVAGVIGGAAFIRRQGAADRSAQRVQHVGHRPGLRVQRHELYAVVAVGGEQQLAAGGGRLHHSAVRRVEIQRQHRCGLVRQVVAHQLVSCILRRVIGNHKHKRIAAERRIPGVDIAVLDPIELQRFRLAARLHKISAVFILAAVVEPLRHARQADGAVGSFQHLQNRPVDEFAPAGVLLGPGLAVVGRSQAHQAAGGHSVQVVFAGIQHQRAVGAQHGVADHFAAAQVHRALDPAAHRFLPGRFPRRAALRGTGRRSAAGGQAGGQQCA